MYVPDSSNLRTRGHFPRNAAAIVSGIGKVLPRTLGVLLLSLFLPLAAYSAPAPQILQSPSISHDRIAFGYAGDLWIVPSAGGDAVRLTTGIGIESGPVFSPDGSRIAFTGEYDGNVDVYVIATAGGTPTRVTYHPGADVATGWTPDGKSIVFRSSRDAVSRYTQLYTVPADGGAVTRLPLPMAYAGQIAPGGSAIAYIPLEPAFGFNFATYTSFGHYRGGRASTIWLTTLPGLGSRQIPHTDASDFSPVFLDGQIYFLSDRNGRIGIFRFDPASGGVNEVYHNSGSDLRSLSTDGKVLIFDRLGAIYTLLPGAVPQQVHITATGDMPDVRPRILKVGDEVQTVMPSPTGSHVVIEAHGEILAMPVGKGALRNITHSPGTMEREPAWSPDGRSIAYFSDEDGLYDLYVATRAAGQNAGDKPARKFTLAAESTYYFRPTWSPDSSKIAFYDNRLHIYVLDLATGGLKIVNEPDTYAGFSAETHTVAWSPDSRWLVYPRGVANHQHVLMLYSIATGAQTMITDRMIDAREPAFDGNGKYLYFLGSNDAGPVMTEVDMSTRLYSVTRSIYALALADGTPSPGAPSSDEDVPAGKVTPTGDKLPAAAPGKGARGANEAEKTPFAPPIRIDLPGLSAPELERRTVPLPLPARGYTSLRAGKPGTIYFLEREADRVQDRPSATLARWSLQGLKKDELATDVAAFDLTADGEKMLVTTALPAAETGSAAASGRPRLKYAMVSALHKVGAEGGESGAIDFSDLAVPTDPTAEWRQMYREVWRIERAYFYDPGFHGLDTVAAEKAYQSYVDALQSRADLNYVFQDMLTGLSVGHLRGSGGAVPSAGRVSGGLLGADYVMRGGRYCFGKIYWGSPRSPDIKAPLGQPGLGVREGDCILAVNGAPLTTAQDIQAPLEGTAGMAVTLRIAAANGDNARDIVVQPVKSEAELRNLNWIEGNRRLVDQLSGGRLAYVFLPDTGDRGFNAFNRTYFAQSDKQGAIIDERFNSGGKSPDYIVEVLGRRIENYAAPRYGHVEAAPGAAIYGPKVMIANEFSGSGGDALPFLFRQAKLGALVGKRTWGGWVGVPRAPLLMDGGTVTAPGVAFFTPEGKWEIENHGIAPDYSVEQDPALVASGHDPQLETAVAVAMRQLADTPATQPARPASPVY
jgi:tricorn protease